MIIRLISVGRTQILLSKYIPVSLIEKNTSIILLIILMLRKEQLLILLLLPNNKFCQAGRFWVSHDQRQPGSILEEGRERTLGTRVFGGEEFVWNL